MQLEIVPSNRVASYYDLKPLVDVSFNSLQLANDRISHARGIDSTSKGGEVDANGKKIARDSLKFLYPARAVLLYAERWFRDSRRDTDRPWCIVSPFAPCWALLSPFSHCPTYRPSLSFFLSYCFSFTLLTPAGHACARVTQCWNERAKSFPWINCLPRNPWIFRRGFSSTN